MSKSGALELLRDCRRLFLRGFELKVNIGIHDFEKNDAQRMLFDVDIYIALAVSTPRSDAIDEVVDYDFIRRKIVQRVARGPHPPPGNPV